AAPAARPPAGLPPRAAKLPARPAAAAAPPASEDLDASLVADGIRALRQERDPARAGVLLETYLRRHPGGPLAEHALAVAIEAAGARADAGAAATLARAYLRRYPRGQFAAAARQALSGERAP
ncbi:MAG TPA: hypothetical protein VGQ83_17630, partial [Polyangia bacterium]